MADDRLKMTDCWRARVIRAKCWRSSWASSRPPCRTTWQAGGAGLVSARMDGHAVARVAGGAARDGGRPLAPGTYAGRAAPDPSAPSAGQALDAFDRARCWPLFTARRVLKQIPVQQKKSRPCCATGKELSGAGAPREAGQQAQLEASNSAFSRVITSLRRVTDQNDEADLCARAGIHWRNAGDRDGHTNQRRQKGELTTNRAGGCRAAVSRGAALVVG